MAHAIFQQRQQHGDVTSVEDMKKLWRLPMIPITKLPLIFLLNRQECFILHRLKKK